MSVEKHTFTTYDEMISLFDPLQRIMQKRFDAWCARPTGKTTMAIIEFKGTLDTLRLLVEQDRPRAFARFFMARVAQISPEALRKSFRGDKAGHDRALKYYKRLTAALADWVN